MATHSVTMIVSEQLPLFVYGTLRHGQENYSLLRGNTVAETPAVIERMALYSLRAYPMIVEGDSVVCGELMTLHPRIYTRLLADLDQLEGYEPGIDRTEGRTELAAWVYVGDARILAQEPHILVAHGDWRRYRHELIQGTRFGGFQFSEQRE
jgi:gamma-glutamylcyclotransferase (GGCT)/AIG2-like uncharacterized protein YtfP